MLYINLENMQYINQNDLNNYIHLFSINNDDYFVPKHLLLDQQDKLFTNFMIKNPKLVKYMQVVIPTLNNNEKNNSQNELFCDEDILYEKLV
jgi:hypothetical protein